MKLWRFVNDNAAFLKSRREMQAKFLFIDLHGDAFENADVNVANVVLLDDGLGFVPAGGDVESFDIFAAGALRIGCSAPLGFVTGPAEDGLQAGEHGDAGIAAVSIPDGFGDNPIWRGEQELDSGGFVGVFALDAVKVIEGEAKNGFEIIGLGHQAEDGVKQAGKNNEADQDTEGDIRNAAQILQEDGCAKCCGETPQHPRLIVELEDGVDAVAELVAQVDELGGEDEDGAEGDDEENKGRRREGQKA